MTRPGAHPPRLLIRVAIYLAIIAVLFAVRGSDHWRNVLHRFTSANGADQSLAVAGRDLAPGLIDRIVANYRRDYPDLQIGIQGGGTARALEELINGRTDVAFLCRQPTGAEQELFVSADGDTLVYYPVALGGMILVRGDASSVRVLTLDELRSFWAAEAGSAFTRLYAADPNLGLWGAFANRLGLAEDDGRAGKVVFLQDEQTVIEAVQADSKALGLIGSLNMPDDLGRLDVQPVPVFNAEADSLAAPGLEEIASGHYPLPYYLYVASRRGGDIQGAKFVTYLTGGRGQRQIERSGYLPARQVLREIYLTNHPVGDTS